MDLVFIASNKPGAGKTALAAALVLHWSRQGRPTAYLRIGGNGAEEGTREVDSRYVAGLAALERPEAGPPTPALEIDQRGLFIESGQSIEGLATEMARLAAEAARQGSRLVVEVSSQEGQEGGPWALCGRLAEAAGGSVVGVVDYAAARQAGPLESQLQPAQPWLSGILVNAAPPHRLREAAQGLPAQMEAWGSRLLGVMPEDRLMLAPTVGQLAERLKAHWVLGQERADDLVCHVLIGGNLMDPGVTYFGRHQDQAVVVRGNRPDIQLAALGSELACLALTGGHQPIPYVLHEARQQQVPLLVVEGDTHATAESLGGVASLGTARHPRKAERFLGLLEQRCHGEALAGLLA